MPGQEKISFMDFIFFPFGNYNLPVFQDERRTWCFPFATASPGKEVWKLGLLLPIHVSETPYTQQSFSMFYSSINLHLSSLSSSDEINRLKPFKCLHRQKFHYLQNVLHFKLFPEHFPAFLQQLKGVECQWSVHHSSTEGSRRLCCTQVSSLCCLNTLLLHAKDDIDLFCHGIYVVLAPNVPQALFRHLELSWNVEQG